MNKPYFVKFLPGKVINRIPRNVDYDKLIPFLCSKNMDIGDKIALQLVPDKTAWCGGTLLWTEADTVEVRLHSGLVVITNPDSYCFKIIGEIASEIKLEEGQAFSQDEVIIHDCGAHVECCEVACLFNWKGGYFVTIKP